MRASYRNTVVPQPNITLTMCCSATGEQLKAQVIVHAKTIPQEFKRLNDGLFITTYYDCGGQTQITFEAQMLDYILPKNSEWRMKNAASERSLLFLDSHASRMNKKLNRKAIEFKIDILTFPSHTTHLLQPLDCGIFSTLKQHLRRVFLIPVRWTALLYRQSIVNALISAHKAAIQNIIIRNYFKKASIHPVNINARRKYLGESRR
ncbi:MAG: hypothetical protein EZS28_028362, partial [Streblomastix strix]